MRFTKLQGLGNDFVLVDARGLTAAPAWPLLAKSVCQRRLGIGADGLLLLLPSDGADFRMRMFNPDGSEAEACGNGLRCLVRYIVAHHLDRPSEMVIETQAGLRQARVVKTGTGTDKIQVSMGRPEFAPENIPVAATPGLGRRFGPMLGDYPLLVDGAELKLSFVSMGNPHAVFFIDYPVIEYPLDRIGPVVEQHQLFPKHVNFEVARVLGRQNIEMRVWERGAGETLACGSGACATMVAARLMGLIDDSVELELPGGRAEVAWDGRSQVWLAGPAEVVFTGEWPGQYFEE